MKPQQLFAAFYSRQCTLIDYLSDIKERLHQPGDQKSYNNMLKQTIVCYHNNQVDLRSFTPSVKEGLHMREVIQRVIEISCHSLNGSSGNIVSLGYQLVRDRKNSTGCASSTSTVVNKYPNSTVRLLTSKCWQILHERIGDDIMVHLLKDLSLFVMVKNNCYMQVAGFPIYNLDSKQQQEQKFQETTNLHQLQGGTTIQQRSGLQAVISQETTNPQQLPSDIPMNIIPGKEVMPQDEMVPQQLPIIQNISMVQELVNEKQVQQETAVSQRLPEDTAMQQVLENTPLQEQVSMECSLIEEIPQKEWIQQDGHFGTQQLQKEKYIEDINEVKKQRLEATTKKRKKPSSFKEPAAKRTKRPEKPGLRNGSKIKDSSNDSNFCSNIFNLYFPQPALMYSTNFRDKFPKHHILSSLQASKRGAAKLVEEMFLESKFVRDNNTRQVKFVARKIIDRKEGEKGEKKVKKNQRIPKRFVKIKGLLEKMLCRHKRCRFNALLKHHCKGMVDLSEEKEQVEIQEKRVQNLEKRVEIQEERVENQEKLEKQVAIQEKRNEIMEDEIESQNEDAGIQERSEKKAKLTKQSEKRKEVLTMQEKYDRAVQNFTPRFQVFRLTTAVCNRVIPKELWGTPQNKKAFYNNLEKFINLNKGEKFSLGQMVNRIKVKDCRWVKHSGFEGKGVPLSESEKQKEVFFKFVWWVVRRYIMLILKTFFYITENAGQTKEIFFYRKPVWKIINDFGVVTMKSDLLLPLSKEEATDILRSNSSLGYSYMRFLPKASTVRPIINMKHHPLAGNTNQKPQTSINSRLRNLFEIIKFEKNREQSNSDSTVFGFDGVYQALSAFHSKRKECNDERSLLMVHVDINKCFDSIPLDKLYSIMETVFKEEEYIVRRFVAIKSVNNVVRKVFNKRVAVGEDCRSFREFLEDTIEENNLRNVVMADQVYYHCEDTESILALLKRHLFENIVKIGSKFYRQIKGIAQGSILSTYLCSYFYSHMEKRYLQQVIKNESSLLMRWVDDFLFLTPDQSLADTFLRIMHAGIPEYGCRISTRKTLVNYMTTITDGIPVRYVNKDEAFPWCGFLIHPKSLETKLDCSRYEDKNKKNSVSRNLHSHPGRSLLEKLRYSLLNKSHPLLLDIHINSRHTVLLNIYEAFFLSACKFFNYCRDFPKGRQIQENPLFFKRVILALPQFFFKQAKLKFKKLKLKSQKPRQHDFALSEDVVTWLCCQAYVRCLKKKPSFKTVVKALRKRSRKLVSRNSNLPQLIYTNPSNSLKT